MQPELSTETAISVCFTPGLFPHNPLYAENRLGAPDFPIAISFIFGRHDWVSAKGAFKTVDGSQFKESGQSQVHVCDKADHNMHNDNPQELIRLIVGDLTGQITHAYEHKLEMYYIEGDETDQTLDDAEVLRPYEQDEESKDGVFPEEAKSPEFVHSLSEAGMLNLCRTDKEQLAAVVDEKAGGEESEEEATAADK